MISVRRRGAQNWLAVPGGPGALHRTAQRLPWPVAQREFLHVHAHAHVHAEVCDRQDIQRPVPAQYPAIVRRREQRL